MYWKRSNHNCNGNRRDKTAHRTTCIFDASCQIKDYQNKDRLSVCRLLLLKRNLNRAAQSLRLGRMQPERRGLDIADLSKGNRWAGGNFFPLWQSISLDLVPAYWPRLFRGYVGDAKCGLLTTGRDSTTIIFAWTRFGDFSKRLSFHWDSVAHVSLLSSRDNKN